MSTGRAESPDREEIVWVEVNCPACGNVNRAARRACRDCGHTGRMRKTMPARLVTEEGS
jgi:uncharacterized OB-fold protein